MATRLKKISKEPLALDRPRIDFLILADRAEAINGKLYLMGGGWSEWRWPDFNLPISFGIAAGVLVPWNATNEEHTLSVFIEHEDGTRIEPQVTAKLNVGRPPSAVRGQSFLTVIAVNSSWKLSGEGMYRAVAVLGEEERRHASFRAVQIAAQPPTPPT
ncbi:MAG: hypothetical protein HYY01_07875 [Chloroflexi bacterium]|nr:hypothetical protein [Chloroflexota bacterium]